MLGKAIWRLRIQENLFGGRRSAPDPAEGAYSAPANPLVGGDGLAVPSQEKPIPRSRPFGPRLFYPHSKISSDAVVHPDTSHHFSALIGWRLSVLIYDVMLCYVIMDFCRASACRARYCVSKSVCLSVRLSGVFAKVTCAVFYVWFIDIKPCFKLTSFYRWYALFYYQLLHYILKLDHVILTMPTLVGNLSVSGDG